MYTHWDSKLHGLHTQRVYEWSDSLYNIYIHKYKTLADRLRGNVTGP